MQKNRISLTDFLKQQKKSSGKHDDEEHRIQCSCVKWFRMQYPQYQNILFAIPNAARRTPRIGAYMKDEGMLPGVADLIFLKSNRNYSALCIEMKTKDGRQSESQKKWEKAAKENGIHYIVCRSFDEFRKVVTDYINDM